MAARNELRLFISSTFHDLQEEREYLAKKIFPEIRSLCRSRGITFTDIDLRWGLTEEQATLGQVIRTCLEEIDQCRPYFLGIVGSRYGWVPEFHEVQMDFGLLQKYPWLEDAAIDGASILEMEFTYGVFNQQLEGNDVAAHFYIREQSDTPSDDRERLDSLIGKVRSCGRPVRDFVDTETLGQQVRRDLAELIDRYWPVDHLPSPFELERQAHESFASTRRHAYIANPEYLKRFNEWLKSSALPLVISAPSGMGKSSLVAYLVQSHLRRNPGAFVISYYTGAGTSATDHFSVIRHIMEEIKERYSLDDEVPSTPESIEKEFPIWLTKVRDELLLVIDSVNHLASSSRQLAWLPRHIPSNVHLLISTTPEETLDRLRERDWIDLELQPLNSREREALIVRYLGEFHKGLSPQQVRRIATDEKAASPLFLRTLVEDLRLFGQFELLDDHIDHYLAAADLNEVFDLVLERMERDYGEENIRRMMSLIGASLSGLTETELLDLAGILRVDLSTLLHALDYHLLRNNGQLNFFHDYLRRAVERRYLPDDTRKQSLHLLLAEYFEQQLPDDRLLVDRDSHLSIPARLAYEVLFQLEETDQKERLEAALTNLALVERMCDDGNEYELLRYWSRAGGFDEMGQRCRERLEKLDHSDGDPLRCADLYSKLGDLLEKSSRYDRAEPLLRRAVEIRREVLGDGHPAVARAMRVLGLVLRRKGDFAAAETVFREAIEIYDRSLGREHAETAICLNSYGVFLRDKGDYQAAEAAHREALRIQERLLGDNHLRVAGGLSNLAFVLMLRGEYSAAESLYRRSIDLFKRLLGDMQIETATSLNGLSSLLRLTGDLDGAESAAREALTIYEHLLGEDHTSIAMSLYSLGTILRRRGDAHSAETFFRRALTLHQRLMGKRHLTTATYITALAQVLQEQGELSTSESLYAQALEIYRAIAIPNHPITAYIVHQLGLLRLDLRDLDGAEVLLQEALSIREEVLGSHDDTAETHELLARLYQQRGDTAKAIQHFESALKIRCDRQGSDHPTSREIVGMLSQLRGEREEK